MTRDTDGDRPTQIFYCTNLEMDVQQILSTDAHRWAIEVTHHDAKQLLGLEDPANRLPLAVERTAPMAMLLYSLRPCGTLNTAMRTCSSPTGLGIGAKADRTLPTC